MIDYMIQFAKKATETAIETVSDAATVSADATSTAAAAATGPTSGLKIAITIVFALLCVVTVVLVMMQKSKSAGLGSIGGAADTYWSKNKSRSNEGLLVKATTVCLILFFVIALILSMNI